MMQYFISKSQQVSKFVESSFFFYLILCFNILLMSSTKFYPTMDGAAHLYNSKLLVYLLNGNDFLNQFYTINSVATPNWLSHLSIAAISKVFPIWLAEKTLIIGYISGMAFSFRYFLKQVNPDALYTSLLIFPFSYTFLFYLGFYNFSISFIFLFFAIGYFIKNIESESYLKFLVLSALITLCYFSNILTYGFLGLTLGLLCIQYSLSNIQDSRSVKNILFSIAKSLFWLLIASIPSLILQFIFLSNVTFFPTNEAYPAKELVKWILDVRSLIIYTYEDEILTQPMLLIMVALFVLSIRHIGTVNKRNFFSLTLLVQTILSAILLFLVPDGSGSGMMSYRYLIIFFFFALLWLASIIVHNNMNRIILIIAVTLHIGLLFKHYNGAIKDLNHHAEIVYNTSDYIDSNKIILPVNLSDHWVEPHFSNYLGLKKPELILENYEAGVGWFPIRWRLDKMPNFQINGESSIGDLSWVTNKKSTQNVSIDYIFVYGNLSKLKEAKWNALNTILANNFELKYETNEGYVLLYKRK
jgi:hypothetical protein